MTTPFPVQQQRHPGRRFAAQAPVLSCERNGSICYCLLSHQDLWRLKIDKGGRILFEVAVEFIETERRWWVLLDRRCPSKGRAKLACARLLTACSLPSPSWIPGNNVLLFVTCIPAGLSASGSGASHWTTSE
jgi:hypothetical protein